MSRIKERNRKRYHKEVEAMLQRNDVDMPDRDLYRKNMRSEEIRRILEPILRLLS